MQVVARSGESIDMEACFSQLTLNVIGKAVFNYDFDALTTSSPVIQVTLDHSCRFPCNVSNTLCYATWLFHSDGVHLPGMVEPCSSKCEYQCTCSKLSRNKPGGGAGCRIMNRLRLCTGSVHSAEGDRTESHGRAAAMEAALSAPANTTAAQGQRSSGAHPKDNGGPDC